MDTFPLTSVRVQMPCTCGELFQGTVDGVPCLVSCPVTCYAEVYGGRTAAPGWRVQGAGRKVAAALERLREVNPDLDGGMLAVHNPCPVGRGYGTSTADIGAALYVAGALFARELAPLEIARLAVSVEPTDSTVFPGLTVFDHRMGSFDEYLGEAPPLSIAVLDPGGEVDTEAFNGVDHTAILQALAAEHRQAFELLRGAIACSDLEAFGAACTRSTVLHQRLLPNPLLANALHLARETGAVGVCRAHSGTLLGLLYAPERGAEEAVLPWLSAHLPTGVHVAWVQLTGGGIHELDRFPA